MLMQSVVIAHKEILDSLRDVRSLASSFFYALMGPLVVGMVSMAVRHRDGAGAVLGGMMAVFTLVAAFVGGMNVASDTVAGERERRSLVPLLLNPVSRFHVTLGKWIAVAFFALCGLIVNLTGFAIVFSSAGMRLTVDWPATTLILGIGLLPLALLAASLQLFISTVCRSVKEAQTYLSLVVFLPMSLGMFLIFFAAARQPWCRFLPVFGQQLQLQSLSDGTSMAFYEPLVLGCVTLMVAAAILIIAGERLQRDEIVYGN